MSRTLRTALIVWGAITSMVIGESLWIYTRHGLDGFQAFMQEAPHTYTPVALASVAITWLSAGCLLWAIHTGRITKATLPGWAGFFTVAFLYLNVLRERIRYGDVDYYVEAAFALFNDQPLPVTYIYPPLWATLLSLFTRLGEDGILLVCWLANVLSLLLFYYLLHQTLQHYGFKAQTAALVTTVFMLVNMPVMRTLLYIQVNFHVMNLIFLSILFYRERPFLSALALALAVHFKASPVVLVLAFLLELDWKWLAWFALNFILIAMFTVAIHGSGPYLDFIQNALLLNGPRTLSMHDSSFDAVIGLSLAYFRADFAVVRILVYLAKGATALAAIFLCIRAQVFYPRQEKGMRVFNALVPLLMAMTISSPLVWEHHGVFLTLPTLLLLKKLEAPAEWVWFGAAYLFEFLTPTFDYFPWSSYSGLLGILILFALLWVTRDRKDSSLFSMFNDWTASLFVARAQA